MNMNTVRETVAEAAAEAFSCFAFSAHVMHGRSVRMSVIKFKHQCALNILDALVLGDSREVRLAVVQALGCAACGGNVERAIDILQEVLDREQDFQVCLHVVKSLNLAASAGSTRATNIMTELIQVGGSFGQKAKHALSRTPDFVAILTRFQSRNTFYFRNEC